MRKQTPLIAFAIFVLSARIAHAQFLFWLQYTSWPDHYAPFKYKHHHRQTNSELAKTLGPRTLRRARRRGNRTDDRR
jgi:hypothetical protein